MSGLHKSLNALEENAPGRQEDEKEGRKPHVLASIEQDYLNEANREDEALIRGWTETLNILLTFAGLLSATITSFLLAVQPDLQPAPADTTNQILLQILQRLDNTTLQTGNEGQDTSENTGRVLAWWYASLACSLASAFGALMSKQWVLHYQGTPRWVTNPERQCHVREGRHNGLRIWHFNTILELLPVLLQMSLLLFAIGLADYLYPIRTLFLILIVAIAVVGTFFFATFFAGVFFLSCPFKTPITGFMITFTSILGVWVYSTFYLIPKLLVWHCMPARGDSRSTKRQQLKELTNKLKYHTGGAVRRTIGFRPGDERRFSQDAAVMARLLCWKLQHRIGANEPPVDGLEGAADTLMAHPFGAVTFHQRYSFFFWCTVVTKRISHDQLHVASCAVEADLLCHVMHHVPKSKATIAEAIRPMMGSYPSEERTLAFLADHLRRSWGKGTIGNLPVALMRPASIIIYLECQIYRWALAEPSYRLHRDLLLEELPIIMERNYPPSDSQNSYYRATINAITVTAIAMVEHDVPGISIRYICPLDPLEQLFEAIYRLSYYPIDFPSHKLVGLALEASRRILADEDLWRTPEDSSSWYDGKLAESLRRLWHLGRLWWHSEQSMEEAQGPGSFLTQGAQGLITLVDDYVGKYEGTITPSTYSSALEDALTAYSLQPTSIFALQIFTYALATHSRLPSAEHHGGSQTLVPSGHTPVLPILQRHPQVISHLIQTLHDAEPRSHSRRLVLSALVQGRNFFFSPKLLLPSNITPLFTELEALAATSPPSGHAQDLVIWEAFWGFDAWDMLLQALDDVEKSLGSHSKESAAGADPGNSRLAIDMV